MVADAGEAGVLAPWLGRSCLAGTLLAVIGVAMSYDLVWLAGWVGLSEPPQALASQARGLLEEIGNTGRPLDRTWGFEYDRDQLAWVRDEQGSADRWSPLRGRRSAPVYFWYRESPEYMTPIGIGSAAVFADEPLGVAGSAELRMDPGGELRRLLVVPPQRDDLPGDPSAPLEEPDWSVLFERAALDRATFRDASPIWNPRVDSQTRRAWIGPHPDRPDLELRVEAGTYRGRPVYFEVVPPWRRTERQGHAAVGATGLSTAGSVAQLVLLLVAVSGGLRLAYTNLRAGRGDRRGANRLAAAMLVSNLFLWLFLSDHVPDLAEFGSLVLAVMWGLFMASIVWIVYVALEPHARRVWPPVLISWSRLLAGRFRDPMVGRDLVVGAAFGSVISLLSGLPYVMAYAVGWPAPEPGSSPVGGFANGSLVGLTGTREALGFYSFLPQLALVDSLGIVFIILLLRLVLRRLWLALTVGFVLILLTLTGIGNSPTATPTELGVSIAVSIVITTMMIGLLVRFGFLALFFVLLFSHIDRFAIMSPDLSDWYAGRGLMLVLMMLGLATWGYFVSKGKRSGRVAASAPVRS